MPPLVFLKSNWRYRVVKVIASLRSVLSTAYVDSREDIVGYFSAYVSPTKLHPSISSKE